MLMYSEYINFHQFRKHQIMTALALDTRNPFSRSNPFYVPQKFYSQEHISSYPLRNNLVTHHQSNAEINHILLKHQQSRVNHPYQQFNSNHTIYKQEKVSNLKKRNIKDIENPFFRKHLIPTTDKSLPIQIRNFLDANITQKEYQLKHQRLFFSRKQQLELQDKPFNDESFKNTSMGHLPSVKNLFQQKKQKYSSSQLALKLKSQTYLQNSMASPLSKCDTNQIPKSLGKSQKRIIQSGLSNFPQTIILRGKVYYSQNITSIF